MNAENKSQLMKAIAVLTALAPYTERMRKALEGADKEDPESKGLEAGSAVAVQLRAGYLYAVLRAVDIMTDVLSVEKNQFLDGDILQDLIDQQTRGIKAILDNNNCPDCGGTHEHLNDHYPLIPRNAVERGGGLDALLSMIMRGGMVEEDDDMPRPGGHVH